MDDDGANFAVVAGQTVVITCPLEDGVAWMRESSGILFMRDRYVGLLSFKSKYGVEVFPPAGRESTRRISERQNNIDSDMTRKALPKQKYQLKIFDAELE